MNKNKFQSRFWSIILPLLLYFVLYNLSNQIFLLFFRSFPGPLFCLLLAALITLPFMIWAYRRANIERAPKWFEKNRILPEILMILGTAAAGTLMNILFTRLGIIGSPDFQKANASLSSGPVALKIVTSAIAVPILEELLYRGIIAGQLKNFLGPVPAVLISSLLFGAMHFNVVQLLYAAIMGVLLGCIYLKTKKIWVPIAAHGLTNLVVILASAFL